MSQTNTNADMSHQNTLYYKVTEVFDALKTFGIRKTLKKILLRVYYVYKGVDFSTQNLHDLTLKGEHRDHGTALVSTSADFMQYLLDRLDYLCKTEIRKKCFVDFGSGKGAAIIHAKKLGFDSCVGIEFAKELHECALQNIQKMSVKNVTSLHEDAAVFIPPCDTTVIFMFNPFDQKVMKKVVENIAKNNFLNDCYIIYVNPSAYDVLDQKFELLEKETLSSGARVHYYKV